MFVVALVVLAALLVPSSAAANHGALGELLSVGPAGFNAEYNAYYKGVSQDGTKVFIETAEPLVSADDDDCVPDLDGVQGCEDVYVRDMTTGTTTLLSVGPNSSNAPFASNFAAVSQDGSRVFFTTREQLDSADTDGSVDVYVRDLTTSTTSLISIGPAGGNATKMALLDSITPDGSKAFFHTSEPLVTGDTDGVNDLYRRSGGTTTLLSTGPAGGNASIPATYSGSSTDGSKVFFETYERLTNDDTDGQTDVYQSSGGTTTRLSFGPSGGNGDPAAGFFSDASFVGASADGAKVFFETDEALTSDDVDVYIDVYQRFAGGTTRISAGPAGGNGDFDASFRGATADGSKVFLQTNESMTSNDTDGGFQDVYERTGVTTTLDSIGPADTGAGVDAAFVASSPDGSRVFMTTALALTSNDVDGGWRDIYQRFGGNTTLISTTTTTPDPTGASNAFFGGMSQDGSRVFFFTYESLSSADTDAEQDVYERQGTATTLLSLGPNGGNDPLQGAAFAGATTDGTKVFMHSGEPLTSADTDGSQDVYAAIINALFPRPGGGTPLRVPLVPAYKQCAAPNSNHVAPLALPSCTPAQLDSSLLTTSTTGRGQGFAKYQVVPGNPGTPEDEADVSIAASLTDVRNQSDGSDYTGQLVLTSPIRVADRANGYSAGLSGVAQDGEFSVPIQCAATSDPAVGGACAVTTTADTVVPGFAKESKREIISTLGLKVLDAGADGDITPPPNPYGLACPPVCGSGDEHPFATQGIFLP